MTDILNKFLKIYIDEASAGSGLAERLSALAPEKIEWVQGRPPQYARGELTGDQYALSKKILFITPFAGQFFKRCPGAKKGLACCNYFVLNLGQQCDMDCSYCYLQSFINTPYSVMYSNIDKALEEMSLLHRDHADQQVRIGTGEVIDSLSLDPVTLYSRELIEFFRGKKNWRLEFKTKSDRVDQFLDCEHDGNVIVSWSVNPEYIVSAEEHGTASLKNRLDAAVRCRDKGFQIALHVDPVVWHPEWRENYKLLIDEISARFRPEDMPYVSLGALRFQPEQKDMMLERFGMKSWINRAETFPGAAGKMRYDQRLREEMFKFIIAELKARNPRWNVFLCMETPETWLQASGSLPYKQEPLRNLFKPLSL